MWIERQDKEEFTDSKISGLRVTFDKRMEQEKVTEVKKFATWLRKRYYFPIRCNVHICFCSYFEKLNDNDKDSIGDFYYKDGMLPSIQIAGYPARKSEDKGFYVQIQARMAYFLTFYFQWFFYEFDKRSDRSLKIEATKWQNYIMDEYLNFDIIK